MSRTLELWHLASLDAPTVAVVWAAAFAWAVGVHLERWVILLLACGTWTVYVGDRILDALRAIRANRLHALRERHYFHWRHRHRLLPIATGTAITAVFLILRLMPLAVRERDSFIAAAAFAYFSGVHSSVKPPAWMRPIASKEFLVGILFTSGCAAPVVARVLWTTRFSTSWPVMLCMGLFALLAWLNCAAIETWESKEQRDVSFAAATLGMSCAVIGVALLSKWPHVSALIFTAAASAFLILYLDRSRHRLNSLAARTLADLVLLTPVFLLVFKAHRG